MISSFDPFFDTNPCYETRMKGYCIYLVNVYFPLISLVGMFPLLGNWWKSYEIFTQADLPRGIPQGQRSGTNSLALLICFEFPHLDFIAVTCQKCLCYVLLPHHACEMSEVCFIAVQHRDSYTVILRDFLNAGLLLSRSRVEKEANSYLYLSFLLPSGVFATCIQKPVKSRSQKTSECMMNPNQILCSKFLNVHCDVRCALKGLVGGAVKLHHASLRPPCWMSEAVGWCTSHFVSFC